MGNEHNYKEDICPDCNEKLKIPYDTEEGVWLSYVVGGPDFLNTLESFEAGKGYFIYIEQDWTIAP